MKDDKKEWVQCFYNVEFLYYGKAKFACGFKRVKLIGENSNLANQIKDSIDIDNEDIENINIKTLTPFHGNVFEVE